MTKLKIEKMYAFVAENEEGEGVMAFKTKDVWLPMVGADFKRIESLLPVAKELSETVGTKFRILQFDNRTDVTEQFKEEPPIKTIIQRYIKNNKGATKEEIMRYLNEGLKITILEKDVDEILMEEKHEQNNIEYPIVLQLTRINAEHLIESINMADHEGVHYDDTEELRDYLEKKLGEL